MNTEGKVMRRVFRTMGILVISLVVILSVYGQDVKKDHSKHPATTSSAATTQDYVFPTQHERFKRYVSGAVGPFALARTAASAGIGQWRDSPEEWGQGAKGYGRRFASGMGQNLINQTVTYGLDEAMGLDTGFQRSKRDGFFPRFKDALIQNVTSRTKSGDRVVSVPRFAGIYTGAIVARETWYPDRYNYKDGLRSGSTSLLTGFGINLVREFVFNW
ncbi:MAG TPA: hypothetical protein VIW74_06940 [Pyrinomonadaceae bacterium]